MKKIIFLLALVGLGSCTYNDVEPVLYFSKVKTIINNNCMHCHSESKSWYGKPVGFDTDSGIAVNAAVIKFAVTNKVMPKGGSLSQSDINTIVAWANAGGQTTN